MEIAISPRHRIGVKALLSRLLSENVPFAIGGAFALNHYTGIWRDTKDMDVFILPDDVDRILELGREAGFKTWIQDQHWLAKGRKDGYLVDFIFGGGNWLQQVSQDWLRRAHSMMLFDLEVKVLAPEEIIWSKAYVAHRDRYDGADIVHLLHYAADQIDWQHLSDRFNAHPSLLLSYLALFTFAFPWNAHMVPEDIIRQLMDGFHNQRKRSHEDHHICWGMLLDPIHFAYDVEMHNCADPREILAAGQGVDPSEVRRQRQDMWKQQLLDNELDQAAQAD